MSQTRIKRRLGFEAVEFSADSWTERGERVYKTLRVTLVLQYGNPITRVITCDKQTGITEEWIEDTLMGCFGALETDYPYDDFKLTVVRPNDVTIYYSGPRGTRDSEAVN